MDERLERLRATLAERDLPALLVSGPGNRRYLSGFTGSYGWLLVTPTVALLFTDGRYMIRAAREAPAFALRQVVNPGRALPTLLSEAAAELGLARIAFEAAQMSVAEHANLVKALGGAVELVPVEGLVEPLRERKDATELRTMRRAIAITDAAFAAVLERLTPETTEAQAAWMLEVAMRVGGAEGLAFPVIVAAGPNGAQPHASPGDEPLGSGRPIVIDMGARLGGYNADLTRTVVLGTPDDRFHTIYELVKEAQAQAIAGIGPGVLTHAVDTLARDRISAAGYGEQFNHGLGHGVGLDVHEGPALRRILPGSSSPPLQPGMVTSVEPGIYLEGWGGVRIEDLVLVTAQGHEVLSQAKK